MTVGALLAGAAGAVAMLVSGPASAAAAAPISAGPIVALDTGGGDAWAFDHVITGRISSHSCDSVTVRAPSGRFHAWVAGETFLSRVHLWPGTNPLTVQCWKGKVLLASAEQRWEVKVDDVPHAFARVHVERSLLRFDAGNSEPAPGRPAPIVRYKWELAPGSPAPLTVPEGEVVTVVPPSLDGVYKIRLSVTDSRGRSDSSGALFRVTGGQAVEEDSEVSHPEWLERAVIYALPLPLLSPVGFEGARIRLSQIKKLGATAIWLSPVTEAPVGDFGYAMTDATRLRAAYGTAAQLHSLVDEAHVNGLRVILDVVTNHLAEGSAYFSQATRLGVRSAYYAWFERDRSGQVKHYFDWHNLNNLNYDNPEVRAYLTASLAHWIRDFGFDGFRLDAAWAPRERAPEFWPQVRRELRRIDPQVALFAEASGRDPYYSERHFEAVYDWTGKLGEWAWNEVFAAAGATPDLARLRAALSATTDCAEREPLVVRFLDNNDTGARFGTRYGLGQNRAAAALLFTVAGLPVIYAGDEVGASYEPYGGLPIVWPNNTDLQSLYMRLIALRLGDPALRSGCLNLLSTDRDDSVIAFARRAAGTSGPRSVVAINFSSSETAVRLPGFGPIRLRPHDFAVLQDESSGRAAALGPR